MVDSERFSLEELERRAEVPARQIRELIRLGVLPAASSGGRGATYGLAHLLRLAAWKRLRAGSPRGTTTEQLRILIDRLDDAGLLRGVADGSLPFALVDDGREEVSIGRARSRRAFRAVAQAPGPAEPDADSRPAADIGPQAGQGADADDTLSSATVPQAAPIPAAVEESARNDDALAYLRGLAGTARRAARSSAPRAPQDASPSPSSSSSSSLPGPRPTARVAVEPSSFRPTLEVDLGASRRPRAVLALERLRGALEDYVAAQAAGVRVSPAKSETWQRVVVGRDLEIAARGPLDHDDVLLLETVARLLEQAIYRRSEHP